MNTNQKTTCTRKLSFCAGHRVMGHENKCATPHGHNYTAYITAEADELDPIGRVIDFSVLKEKVGGWIDEHWDHTFMVYEKDVETLNLLQKMPATKPPSVCKFNPTAENIAEYLLKVVAPTTLKETGIIVTKVVIYETENCSAESTLI